MMYGVQYFVEFPLSKVQIVKDAWKVVAILLDIRIQSLQKKINENNYLDQYHVRNGHDISPGICSL